MTDNNSGEELTPAQKHCAEAERLLVGAEEAMTNADVPPEIRHDRANALTNQAQVHATLAAAASNEALLQFVATHVTNTVVDGLNKYLGGGTTYNVSGGGGHA